MRPTPPLALRAPAVLPPARASDVQRLRRRSTGSNSTGTIPPADGSRLTLARETRGLTRAELANRIRVDDPQISKLEANLVPFRAWMLQRIAYELDFPEPFFLPRPGRSTDLLDQADFRRHQTRAHVRELTRAHRWTELLTETADQVPEQVDVPAVAVQPMAALTPEHAAHRARDLLQVGPSAPIVHLIAAVERAGVQVIGIPLRMEHRGTFSTWHAGRPLITVLAGQTADRLRFGVAHELAHLLLHNTSSPPEAAEDEANRFAAELLVPAGAVADQLPGRPTLDAVRVLNATWKAPLPLLLRRMREAGLVNVARYKRLLDQLTTRPPGPPPGPVEKPRGFRHLIDTDYGTPVDLVQLGYDLSWTPSLAREVLDQYATDPTPEY